MAIDNKIQLNASSDVSLEDWSINIKKGNWLHVSSAVTSTSLSGTITTEFNSIVTDRQANISVSGDFEGRTICTPEIPIKQSKHPAYYLDGETKIMEAISGTPSNLVSLEEEGGDVIILTQAINPDDETDILTTPDYFTLSVDNMVAASGTCSYTITKSKYVEDNTLRWNVKIHKNVDIIDKTLTFEISFDNGLGSFWTDTVTVNQNSHLRKPSEPTLSISPKTIGYLGGVAKISNYYYLDGIKTSLDGVEIDEDSVSGFSKSDYVFTSGYCASTLEIKENESDETSNGTPNKKIRVKAINPIHPQTFIYTDYLLQQTKIQSHFCFWFADGTLTKNMTPSPYSRKQRDISFEIISTKDGEDIGVNIESKSEFVEFKSYSNGILTLTLMENTSSVVRQGEVEISQEDSTMEHLKIKFSQYGENVYVLADFDYMICNVGCDTFSGSDLDVIMYAPEMPEAYEKYKCVGWKSGEWLLRNDLLNSKYPTLKDVGDEDNYIFAYGGDSQRDTVIESFVFKPKYILNDEFINNQIDLGKTTFDVDFYANFYDAIYNGLVTIDFSGYNEEYSEEGLTLVDSGYGEQFVPGNKAELVCNETHNAWVYKYKNYVHGGEVMDFKNDYAKIGTLRYEYNTGIWTFIQNNNAKVTHKRSSEIKAMDYVNYIHQANTAISLYKEELFGSFKCNDDIIDFVTLGPASYCYLGVEDDNPHTLSGVTIYYDQTRYQLTGVANPHDAETHGLWMDDTTKVDWVYSDTGHTINWTVSNGQGYDNMLWVNFTEINKPLPITKKTIKREVHYVTLDGSSNGTIPTCKIEGTLFDSDTNTSTNFTITSGETPFREITWDDTDIDNSSQTKYVTIKSLNGYDNSVSKLNGFDTYNTIVDKIYTEDGVPLGNFNYKYNSPTKNLRVIWGTKAKVQYSKTFKVYVTGNSDIQYTSHCKIAYSDTATLSEDSTAWDSYYTTGGPNSSSRYFLWTVTVHGESLEGYAHIKIWCRNNKTGETTSIYLTSNLMNSINNAVELNLGNGSFRWFKE